MDDVTLDKMNSIGWFPLEQIEFVIEEAGGDVDFVLWTLKRLAGQE